MKFSSIEQFLESIPSRIAAFVGLHKTAINDAIADAQEAAAGAVTVATALNEPPSVTAAIGKISDGLALARTAVNTAATAETYTDQANNLATLTTDLVSSGDLGIKNQKTVAAVGQVATKAVAVVTALQTAAAAAPPPA